MYDDLIKALRETDFSDGCPCEAEPMCQNEDCIIAQAADAIEELSRKYIEERNAAVELTGELASKPRWIPVTERLPKYGERVLVFGGVTMYVAYYDKNRYGGESWHKLNSKSHYCNPTHWMPLPEPPKEE